MGGAVARGTGALRPRTAGEAQEPLQHGLVAALPARISRHVIRSRQTKAIIAYPKLGIKSDAHPISSVRPPKEGDGTELIGQGVSPFELTLD